LFARNIKPDSGVKEREVKPKKFAFTTRILAVPLSKIFIGNIQELTIKIGNSYKNNDSLCIKMIALSMVKKADIRILQRIIDFDASF
jgi:hypothetical protein